MESIRECLSENPLIAACRPEDLPRAVNSKASMVLLLKCSLSRLVRPDFQELGSRKPILLHTDMIKGLSGDKESILFLKDFIRPAGIVSTRSTTLRAARSVGLPVIQRVFLIDSSSLKSSLESIRENRPDAVEIMPGIATDIYKEIRAVVDVPLIAAGLIRSREAIHEALFSGADAVSLSSKSYWDEQLSALISARSLQKTR